MTRGFTRRSRTAAALLLVGMVLMARPAYAYIGPGAGVSVLGTVFAFLGAVLFAIVGFVWYPLKRLIIAIRGLRSGKSDGGAVAP
jgi:hypothetical protein